MNQILSILLCYVLLSAESFAMRGWGTKAKERLSGSYSAILTQTSLATAKSPVATTVDPMTGIISTFYAPVYLDYVGSGTGLVLFTVPSVGAATGSFLLFDTSVGTAFSGNINGLTNPRDGGMSGVLSGTKIADTSPIPDTVGGTIVVKVAPRSSQSGYQEIEGTASTKASDATFYDGTTYLSIDYAVVGYQQSSQVSAGTGFSIGNSQGAGGASVFAF